jgi:glycerophosphoryl diester phosphodiesterase
VHPFTFRAENNFLSAGYRVGGDPSAFGNYLDETRLYLELGIDGFFTDQPDLGVSAVAAISAVPEPSSLGLLAAGGMGLLAAVWASFDASL